MKLPFLLATLLLSVPVVMAQDVAAPPATPPVPTENPAPAEEKPRPIEFNFVADFDKPQNHITWSAVAPGTDEKDDFFLSDSGLKGTMLSEKIAFLDEKRQLKAILTAEFDANGQLQSQKLADADGKITLTQDKFEADKPLAPVAVEGSGITVQTVVKNGFLAQRFFTFDYPTWIGTLGSDYDEKGRRARDVFSSSTSDAPRTINYSYDEKGLSAMKVEATLDSPETLMKIERDNAGQVREMRTTNGEELISVSTSTRDDKGEFLGTRSENYTNGALSGILEMRLQTEGEKTLLISTERDAKGVMQRRITQANGILVSVENFENGKLRERMDADAKGNPQTVTRFRDDGSVESKQPVISSQT